MCYSFELQGPEGDGAAGAAGENGAPKKAGGRGRGRIEADPAKLDSAMESYWNQKSNRKSAGDGDDGGSKVCS